MIRSMLRRLFRRLLLHPPVHRLYLATVDRFATYCAAHRQAAIDELVDAHLHALSPQRRVMTGPFQGMTYSSLYACGSQLPPKIIGCYETELHAWIRDRCREGYSRVVDVGCAEGYYATGLGLLMPDCEIWAYDPLPEARALCAEMARANGIADRLHLGDACFPDTLRGITRGRRCLVVSDCEGFEFWLFTAEVVADLAHSAVLVEVHDFIAPGVGDRLAGLFSTTHACERIPVLAAAQRMPQFRDLIRAGQLPGWLADRLIDEVRPPGQYWLCFTPRPATDRPPASAHP